MIRRLYVDNFRSLVDFTWTPGKETLVLGYNGSGKTTALDALDLIRDWAGGRVRIEDLIDSDAMTRWIDSESVRFELDIEVGEELFLYRVTFEFPKRDGVATVALESLWRADRPVFTRSKESVTASLADEASVSQFPLPRNQSAVSSLSATEGSDDVEAFLTALGQMVVVRPMPPLMETMAERAEKRASYKFENFVAWYWHQTANGLFQRSMLGLLNDVWEEFDYLKLDRVGKNSMTLSAVFKRSSVVRAEMSLEFFELSEGERMLVVLYSLLAYQRSSPATTIVVDEPDNFVALSELQPWLLKILDERPEGGQLIFVSHNPEVIQTMGYEHTAYFERADHESPSRVRKLEPDETGLSLSDRLRRGWLDPVLTDA